jgi:hypothetical protein
LILVVAGAGAGTLFACGGLATLGGAVAAAVWQ